MAALSTSAPLTRAMPDVSHPATKILDVSGKATEENHVGKGARERERERGREEESARKRDVHKVWESRNIQKWQAKQKKTVRGNTK